MADSTAAAGYTHSTYLAQYAGSDMAMKQQLVRMVHMMNKLNKVSRLRNKDVRLCA